MIFITAVFLTILPFILGETKPFNLDPAEKTVCAKLCENDDFKRIEERLDKLRKANDNMELKIDSLLNRQHPIQRCELNDLEVIKTTLKTEISQITSENLAELKTELKESQLIWKNVLIEIKSTFQSLESKKISVKINPAELEDILEEIKLTLKTYLTKVFSDKFDYSSNSSQQTGQSASNTTIKQYLPANCDEALQKGGENGVYRIKILNSEFEFDVYCLSHVANEKINSSENATAWLVVQRREDGSEDFYRNWTDYQHGFGNLKGEFFIGLDKLYALTQSTSHQLLIEMENFNGTKFWAKYDSFGISGASDGYALTVLGTYTGTARNLLKNHKGAKWTTKDKDNDEKEDENCAVKYHGAWWYLDCFYSDLNGRYLHSQGAANNYERIFWGVKMGLLKYVHMAVRPAP